MSPEFERFRVAFDAATQQGLVAAAGVYQGAVREQLQRGYTSGNFTQGIAAASVQMTPVSEEQGEAAIRVGTALDYPLFWELGHFNIFTRKYERVPVWQDTIEQQAGPMAAAFGGEVKVRLEVP